MIDYKYYEYDGMDPGLQVSDYDGAEYELDEFGERIGSEDISDSVMDDDMADDMEPAEVAGDGFRETIRPDDTDIEEQLQDDLEQQATKADEPADSQTSQDV